MKAINRRTGEALKVRKFRDEFRNDRRKSVRWTREGSLRQVHEAMNSEREEYDGE